MTEAAIRKEALADIKLKIMQLEQQKQCPPKCNCVPAKQPCPYNEAINDILKLIRKEYTKCIS